MIEEQNKLLVTDLCARLPYGVNVYCEWNYFEGERTNDSGILVDINLYKKSILFKRSSDNYTYTNIPLNRIDGVVKPYLRPMSSMTEEEIDQMWDIYNNDSCAEGSARITDFLLERHLDCHRLIEKGLALEAPKNMYI